MKKINWDREDSDQQVQKPQKDVEIVQEEENPRLLVISVKDDPHSVKNKLIKKLKIYRAFQVLTAENQLEQVLKDCEDLKLKILEKQNQGSRFRVKVREMQPQKIEKKEKDKQFPKESKYKEQMQQSKYQKNKTKAKESKPYPKKKQSWEDKSKNSNNSALQDALQGKNRYSRY